MLTKQRIKLKTKNSERVLDIPDYLFEVILEERKKYEKNKRRRINDKNNPFLDQGYVCCSTYGKPRSKGFHNRYYNKIFDLCFSKRDPFIIRRTPAAIPVASTQIPITRLDTADDPIALYIFSFIKTNLLKLTKFNILIHSYFNTTSVDIATWICYS